MAETVAAKASETDAVVRRWQKQKEGLCSRYLGGSQWNQRGSGDGGEKSSGNGGGGGGGGIRNMDNGFGGS